MRFVMQLADSITVLDFGKQITHGRPEEVQKHPDVIAAYTGVGAHS